MPERWSLVLTCEHAVATVPAGARALFRGRRRLLAGHRALDAGALELARDLARRSGAPLFAGRATRLLIDLNRSLGHPRLFSEVTRALAPERKQALIEQFWRPHRAAVAAAVARGLARGGRVLHVGLHSFTPALDGVVRELDVGLLYDPARSAERRFCAAWKRRIEELAPALRVRRNQPYRGRADGLTTALRRRFGARYLGLELELNQRLARAGAARRRATRAALIEALARAFPAGGFPSPRRRLS